MKKQYTTPSVSIVGIHAHESLLAGSGPETMSIYDTNVEGGDEILSRRHYSFWGDDEEE